MESKIHPFGDPERPRKGDGEGADANRESTRLGAPEARPKAPSGARMCIGNPPLETPESAPKACPKGEVTYRE